MEEIWKKYGVSEKRKKHSLAVAKLAKDLAIQHNYKKPTDAYTAGLYHDIAKDLSYKELLGYAKKYNYSFSENELSSPSILHAPISSLIAQHSLGITEQDILGAIRYHTTGRAEMSLLEKIVYIADIVDCGKEVDHAHIVMKLAHTDLNKAVYITAKETLKHLLDKEKIIHPNSLECYNYYRKLVNSN